MVNNNINLSRLIVHFVENRLTGSDVKFSNKELVVDASTIGSFIFYFLSPFKSTEFFNLFHETDIQFNEVFSYCSSIFDNPDNLLDQSVNLAKHLYEKSTHPKIQGGEFYTVLFKDCILDNKKVDAIGLFKSETKDTFLKVHPSTDGFEIEAQRGVNINHLDKGCLIFNTEKENGYVVAVVDNTNKGEEAKYWIHDFLHVKPRQDEYFHTQNLLSAYKNFVTKDMPTRFDVTKADQVDLLNRSMKFFKEKDSFDLNEFTEEVIHQPEVIDRFHSYKTEYSKDRNIEFSDHFDISESAVKKQSRIYKSIIKLDKNFHIYIHGHRDLLEHGIDENGRKFYKLYYENES